MGVPLRRQAPKRIAPPPAHMFCLACGAQIPFASLGCSECGTEFELIDPNAKPNHISQLMTALLDCLDGELEHEDLVAMFEGYYGLLEEYFEKWGDPTDPEFVLEVEPSIRGRFEKGLRLIGEGLQGLVLGLELACAEAPDLEASYNALNRFLHQSGGGCALVLKELIGWEHEASLGGLMINIGDV